MSPTCNPSWAVGWTARWCPRNGATPRRLPPLSPTGTSSSTPSGWRDGVSRHRPCAPGSPSPRRWVTSSPPTRPSACTPKSSTPWRACKTCSRPWCPSTGSSRPWPTRSTGTCSRPRRPPTTHAATNSLWIRGCSLPSLTSSSGSRQKSLRSTLPCDRGVGGWNCTAVRRVCVGASCSVARTPSRSVARSKRAQCCSRASSPTPSSSLGGTTTSAFSNPGACGLTRSSATTSGSPRKSGPTSTTPSPSPP